MTDVNINQHDPLLTETDTDESQQRNDHRRKGEDEGINWASWVPAGFVMSVIIFEYTVFFTAELAPQIKHNSTSGWIEFGVFHFFFAAFIFNYFATMIKCPGEVPHDDEEWQFKFDTNGNIVTGQGATQEVKADGDRRRCKWCVQYKPDRSHHCRICRKCVLKMDHHCPWVNNCVGWKNHKNFVLTCFYGFSVCLTIAVTCLIRLVEKNRRTSLEGSELGLLVTAMICAFALFIPLVSLYAFHIWLALKGLSTIEFCEKRSFGAKYRSRYYQTPMRNLKNVLGDNILTWFCCFGYPSGDGMHFDNAPSRVKVDLSAAKPTAAGKHKDKMAEWKKAAGDPELERGSGQGSARAESTA